MNNEKIIDGKAYYPYMHQLSLKDAQAKSEKYQKIGHKTHIEPMDSAYHAYTNGISLSKLQETKYILYIKKW